MKYATRFSRRRFLTVSSLSLGLWACCSKRPSAHAVREFVDDAGRTVRPPDLKPEPEAWDGKRITAAWLGHSTVLLNFYGVRVLTDPVLLNRIGASSVLGNIGPKRLVGPALKTGELPEIDLVLLSHAHMDHLDFGTLARLRGQPQGLGARGTADLLRRTSLSKPHTLGWGETARVATRHGELCIRAFEVRHWGARWRYDTHRGYNGYILEREGRKLIFGGDTAMTASFAGLKPHGPFDLAIMPIGAYSPWRCSHCSPEEAVTMTNAAGAAYILPVHFKTFRFGREGTVEPMERLQAAIEPERIGWRNIGETFCLAI